MHRVFTRADGTVAVMHFATDDPRLIQRDTDTFLSKHTGSTIAGDDLPLPASRRFRDAWEGGSGLVAVSMPRARAQVLAEIRRDRDAALAKSDGEMLRAQEQGADTRAIAARRQQLRGLPAAIAPQLDAASTPEDLDAVKSGVAI